MQGHKGYGRTKSELEKRHREMVKLHNAGVEWHDISVLLGYKSPSTVYGYLTQAGYKPNKKTALSGCEDDISDLILYGATISSIAKKYHVSPKTVKSFCIKHNIEQLSKPINKEGHTVKYTETEAANLVRDRWPAFEYVSGYVGTDTNFLVKCRTCGAERSVKLHRRSLPVCAVCKKKEKDARMAEIESMREQEREEKRLVKEAEKAKRKNHIKIKPFHLCPVCGQNTNRPVYCSKQCCNKAYNKRHELRRNRKIKTALIDSDITVEGLFLRDEGVCYLCGERCDWNDRVDVNGVVICGNFYPSIDHVIPLTKGGLHSWDNVKLAHRICNSLKSDQVVI